MASGYCSLEFSHSPMHTASLAALHSFGLNTRNDEVETMGECACTSQPVRNLILEHQWEIPYCAKLQGHRSVNNFLLLWSQTFNVLCFSGSQGFLKLLSNLNFCCLFISVSDYFQLKFFFFISIFSLLFSILLNSDFWIIRAKQV